MRYLLETDGALHALDPAVAVEDFLATIGRTAGEVTVYETQAEYEASPEGIAMVAQKAARRADRDNTKAAIVAVREKMPELANPTAMATIYALYRAVDETKLPLKLRQAVSAYAVSRGLTDVTGLT